MLPDLTVLPLDNEYTGHNLVFLVGCPRSGTTWLQRILATHPQIRTGQESHLFEFYIGPQLRHWREQLDSDVSGRGSVGLSCYFREDEFLRELRWYLFRLLRPMLENLQGNGVFLEKTPAHALFIPEILAFLPAAKLVHLVRDPRDVVASLLSASETWGAKWAPRSANQSARQWIQHVKAVRQGAGHLRPDQFLEIRYEDLFSIPVPALKRVISFLGLDWPEREITAALRKNSPDEVRAGNGTRIPLGGAAAERIGDSAVEPEGFVRRARSGGWKNDLSFAQKFTVWRLARRTMREFGYPWPFPW
jgi:hypothetical protein